jgi:hypothetical protein
MDLKEFTSPLPKPWLDVVANRLETNRTSYVDQEPVPNPPTGEHTLYFSGGGILSSVDPAGHITRYSAQPTATAYAVNILFNDVLGNQTDYELFRNLSPNSTLVIPANSLRVGGVFRFQLQGTVSAGIGSGFTIALGFVGLANLFALTPTLFSTDTWADAPVQLSCDVVVTAVGASGALNVIGSGGIGSTTYPYPMGLVPNFQQGYAIDTTIAHTLTLKYTTSTVSSLSVKESLFYRVVGG